MKQLFFRSLVFLSLIGTFHGCAKDTDKDNEKPIIVMDGNNAFPKPCDTIARGESFAFNAVFSDNIELGNYNIEIHQNFDHHTHGSHVETCESDPAKEPVNPFYFNESYSIPSGSTHFNAIIEIQVPGDIDTGDYHFMVKLTDREGWQSWQSVSVKVE